MTAPSRPDRPRPVPAGASDQATGEQPRGHRHDPGLAVPGAHPHAVPALSEREQRGDRCGKDVLPPLADQRHPDRGRVQVAEGTLVGDRTDQLHGLMIGGRPGAVLTAGAAALVVLRRGGHGADVGHHAAHRGRAGQGDGDLVVLVCERALCDVELGGDQPGRAGVREHRAGLTDRLAGAGGDLGYPDVARQEDHLPERDRAGLLDVERVLPPADRRRGGVGVLVVDGESGVAQRPEVLLELPDVAADQAGLHLPVGGQRPAQQQHRAGVDGVELPAGPDRCPLGRDAGQRAGGPVVQWLGGAVAEGSVHHDALHQIGAHDACGRRRLGSGPLRCLVALRNQVRGHSTGEQRDEQGGPDPGPPPARRVRIGGREHWLPGHYLPPAPPLNFAEHAWSAAA
jgi:hypothetical protein